MTIKVPLSDQRERNFDGQQCRCRGARGNPNFVRNRQHHNIARQSALSCLALSADRIRPASEAALSSPDEKPTVVVRGRTIVSFVAQQVLASMDELLSGRHFLEDQSLIDILR